MGLTETVNRLDKRYGWSLLGFILAAIFGAITLYTEFLRDTRPDLRFEILTDASVLDVREDVRDLSIIYDGADIQRTKQSLRVVVIKVVNGGLQDILRGDYDDRTPLGFVVQHGSLLRAEMLSVSSEYLRQTLRVDVKSEVATFSPVILESQEWFTVKCLILHPQSAVPSIQPVGKVAGVRSLRLIEAAVSSRGPNIWIRTFGGSVAIQAVRLGAYGVAFIAIFLVSVGSVVSVSESRKKRSRKREIQAFRAAMKEPIDERGDAILREYLERGPIVLEVTGSLLADRDELDTHMKSALSVQAHRDSGVDSEPKNSTSVEVEVDDAIHASHLRARGRSVHLMRKAGIIHQEDSRWVPDEPMSAFLRAFLEFLKSPETRSHVIDDAARRQ